MSDLKGIHHVTAIASDPQRNLDFYAGFLGLRLVKRTVNFDDPGTYHLYYGDELGRPGTILTFFPWPRAQRGVPGRGMLASVGLLIPPASYGFWLGRLAGANHGFERIERFGERILSLRDPDGLIVDLVADETATRIEPWEAGPVTAEHAVRGVHGVTLWVETRAPTVRLLTERLGFEAGDKDDSTRRFVADSDGPGRVVDVRAVGDFWPGSSGAGTIHHVAFRAQDDTAQDAVRDQLLAHGLNPTPRIDRQYFHSVYFREPGGVLFEVATEPPGFTVDEPAESLGTALKLPPQYETMRPQLEAVLPPIHLPGDAMAGDAAALSFTHRWLPGEGERVLLTLHGTGGDENDLPPIARELDPSASVLSPRGRILEYGMPRYFRRLAEGVFDEASVREEADALARFLREAADRYGFDPANVMALGYSNGANIATALMLLQPDALRSAVLLRPMVPLTPDSLPNLSGRQVFLGAGQRDPIAPPEEVERLAALYRRACADVTLHRAEADHQLTRDELAPIRHWIEQPPENASASSTGDRDES